MYVTTFYSFKGGVGRTMALINVAVDLARRGRRVLAVDFDLEAPGLDTFDLPGASRTTPGMIDFVSAYLNTGQAPRADEYVFESSGTGDGDGGLWVMPSGAHRDTYAATLARIDWGLLYEQHDGYLLFEDLKEQWREFVNPDYVLIDSRTGHTDVGGICTRQLPDAVVVLFFPNAQNLRGLTKVVRDVRAERTAPEDKDIDLHFVMSNVPDLDDEDQILEKNIASFQRDLGFSGKPSMIHRYDSLALLNQMIFVKERPRSRLAKEYQAVTAEIVRLNPDDRDGALDYITRIRQAGSTPGSVSRTSVRRHLKEVEASHQHDGEVLFRLGTLRAHERRNGDAVGLFSRAIEAGYRQPEVYLRRAWIRRWENDRDGASQDAVEVLQSDRTTPAQVGRALTMIAPEQLQKVADSPAVVMLPPDEQILIAADLDRSWDQAETARLMLKPLISDSRLAPEEQSRARHALVLAYIALGRFSDALELIRNQEPELERMEIQFAFNYGMAMWGDGGRLMPEPFYRVLELEDPDNNVSPNNLQCISFAHWACGDTAKALEYAAAALWEMTRQQRSEFSCWRYLRVPARMFARDVSEMVDLIEGDDSLKPRFINQPGRPPSPTRASRLHPAATA